MEQVNNKLDSLYSLIRVKAIFINTKKKYE